MHNVIGLVQDYKANVPLHMLEAKYKLPIHTIIKVLHGLMTKDLKNENRNTKA